MGLDSFSYPSYSYVRSIDLPYHILGLMHVSLGLWWVGQYNGTMQLVLSISTSLSTESKNKS